MNTYIYAGNSALLVVKDNDLNYEKNRHNECCDKCSPSTC